MLLRMTALLLRTTTTDGVIQMLIEYDADTEAGVFIL